MYIQFQSDQKDHGYTSNYFEDQAKFLLSLATNGVFKVFKEKAENNIHKVIAKIIITSVAPLSADKQSTYLQFTAIDAENDKIFYKGMINF